ncbi:MAG: hypothetical protein JNJ77_10235 [Planctomycetia bacterium]|nr:hypothetical protein [Planctomycetia bacterium]
MSVLLITCCLLLQSPGKTDTAKTEQPKPKPTLNQLLAKLRDLSSEQQAELKKLNTEYAALIAELEAERDSKLAAVLNKNQKEQIARLLAEELDQYRVVLTAKFNRPGQLFKPMKDILGLDQLMARQRLDVALGKPVAENLPKAKAEALVKAFTAAGAKVIMEKQEGR